MAIRLVEIQCRGRGPGGKPVMKKPIKVTIQIQKHAGIGTICVGPLKCHFNTGGHGQRCWASHPGQEKVGDGVECPYAFNYPYATRNSRWKMPRELKGTLKKMI